MEHDFFDMYLEEMRDITPLDRDEMNYVLEGTARATRGPQPPGGGVPEGGA